MSIASVIDAWCPRFLRGHLERLQGSPIGIRLASGAFWSLLGTVVSRGLALLGSIAIARLLGVTGFGELGIINSTVGMFGAFAGFGMGMTATKYIAEHKSQDRDTAGRIICLCYVVGVGGGAVLSAILFLMAPWLARNTLAAPQLSPALEIASIIVFLTTLSGVQAGVLTGLEAFRGLAHINVWSGLLVSLLMVAGAYTASVNGAVWGLAVGSGLTCVLSHYLLKEELKKYAISARFHGLSRETHIMWAFSLPVVLSHVLVMPAMWLCNTMIVNRPGGYSEMGLFNAAAQWRMVLLLITGAMTSTVLPVLSDLHGKDDRKAHLKVLSVALCGIGVVACLVGIPMALAAPLIMRSYGPGFAPGYPTLILLVVAGVLSSVSAVVGQSIAGQGRMWWGFCLNLLWAIVLVVSAKALAHWGALGLAVSTAIAYGVHLISVSLFTWLTLSIGRSSIR